MALDCKDGGPAFPGTTSPKAADAKRLRDDLGIGLYDAKELLSHHGGMSLRDYFAGQAMTSMVAAGYGDRNRSDDIARMAFLVADAMIRESARG